MTLELFFHGPTADQLAAMAAELQAMDLLVPDPPRVSAEGDEWLLMGYYAGDDEDLTAMPAGGRKARLRVRRVGQVCRPD